MKKNGYIGLLSILFVAAIATVAATTVIVLGIASSRSSFALVQGNQAKALANVCVEEALQVIRDFLPFSGSGNLSLDSGTCSYTVTKGTGQNRTVSSIATVSATIRKISVSVTQINPQINVSSWQEIP